MKRMRTGFVALSSVVLLSFAACGGGGDDDGGGTVDARVAVFYDADPSQPDAAVSACSATGDYTESNEAGNNPFAMGAMAEATGQTLTAGGAAFTIGGCMDPLQATDDGMGGGETDGDFYSFTVGGTAETNVRVELTSANGAMLTNFNVLLIVNTMDGLALIDGGVWSATLGGGLVGRAALDPGEYFLAVYADKPVPSGVVEYQVKVAEYTTVCAPASANHTETPEGPNHRDNDMVEIVYGQDGTVYTATAASDAPDDSSITIDVAGSYQIAGNSADVPVAGDYYDADTFIINTGANVDELYVSIGWNTASNADLDFFIFPAADVMNPTASGTRISTMEEIQVVNVAPSTTYWLWIGTYKDMGITLPQDYTVDICGATSFPSGT